MLKTLYFLIFYYIFYFFMYTNEVKLISISIVNILYNGVLLHNFTPTTLNGFKLKMTQ